MRAKQGLWAAVGAGTALAAAGLLVLVSMSVVLALHGWPQVGKADGPSSVALRAQVAAAARTGSVAVAPAVPVAVPVRRRGAARRLPARRRPSASRPGTSTPAPGAAQPGGSSPAPSAPASVEPSAPATHTVGSTVTTVTDTAGGVLKPISPQVADTVTATGQQVGGVVDKVGGTVGDVTGGAH